MEVFVRFLTLWWKNVRYFPHITDVELFGRFFDADVKDTDVEEADTLER